MREPTFTEILTEFKIEKLLEKKIVMKKNKKNALAQIRGNLTSLAKYGDSKKDVSHLTANLKHICPELTVEDVIKHLTEVLKMEIHEENLNVSPVTGKHTGLGIAKFVKW